METRWEVLTPMVHGHENCWQDDDGNPETFATRREAEEALDEHYRDMRGAVDSGNMTDCPAREDYIIRPVDPGTAETAEPKTAAQARSEAIAACFDILTAYLTDHCPDGENWEDFDGAVDELRSALDEAGRDKLSVDA